MTKMLAAAWLCRTSMGFVSHELSGKQSTVWALRLITQQPSSSSLPTSTVINSTTSSTRLFSVPKNGIDNEADAANLGISRLETLQTMLSSHGAPGSIGCSLPDGDLEPVHFSIPSISSNKKSEDNDDETPELIATMSGSNSKNGDEYNNLHPHLYPLAKSKSTGNFICALRRAYADDAPELHENASNALWPIVEAKLDGPGIRLLALNSEYLMRRIVCECDSSGSRKELIDLYNKDLGKDIIQDEGLDRPYEEGSVERLGYGVDKFVLLRVGPFPDIYRNLALGHAKREDESSSLIAAEVANSKISGFASTFLFYSTLLNSFPNRSEETRDAARICLRMPLPSIGLTAQEFREVAVLGQIANESDSDEEIFAKLQIQYQKIRDHDNQDDPRGGNADMTPEQKAIDEANYLIDTTALAGSDWSSVRPKLAKIYKSVGQDDMARFVYPTN
eukprot:CAMPEP_0170815032 /NCGR_PEP_ID=MMETSP0733-20121128/38136_1 /TAXON_ID=186038 /ORGANISM="Fragilariopsis kerguelensis, Strain L26-C5" /LENGTH=448 /DNA_ID=CAMNT_0011173351 /DNA_START=31 /DNA_END=1377 /DNA_ORIENTATION=+